MDVNKEIAVFKRAMNNTCDFVAREIAGKMKFCVFYVDGMVDGRAIDQGVVAPLIGVESLKSIEDLSGIFSTAQKVEVVQKRKEAIEKLCAGASVIIADGVEGYSVCAVQGYVSRAVTEPPTSSVIKGPREGFAESIKTNMTLIRRRFASEKLVFRTLTVGRATKTHVELCYVKGIARTDVVKEVARRIKEIDIDGVVDSSIIAKFLESRRYSLFRRVGETEKPDVLSAKLLDGRVGIIVDGSPIVLTLPFVMMEDFLDAGDYYRRPVRATVVRIMRLLGTFFAIFLPGAFVSLQTHQYQILPVKLLITTINSTNGIPFSPVMEMLIALVLFEVLGEASVRMPRYFGMAMSVVGGIILGQTAVSAGVLSSLTVLITALSSIGLFVVPSEVGTLGTIRLIYVLVGGALGIYGILLLTVGITAYVTSMESYGVAYLTPFAPLTPTDLKDSIYKASILDHPERTVALGLKNKVRLNNGK